MWIVIHRPVEIDGQYFMPGQGEASQIPPELESKMDTSAKRACIYVADDAFKPKATAPEVKPLAPPPDTKAPVTEAK